MAMILITHDLGIVARVTDRVAVMYAGQIVETGAVKDVFSRPVHPYTQGLLDCIPIPGKTRRGEFLGSIPGMVPTPVGRLTGCTFRNRCSLASQECLAQGPEMRGIEGSHAYRCLRAPEEVGKRSGAERPGQGKIQNEK
jgi:peptide/nickel transport system ATP-binding protein